MEAAYKGRNKTIQCKGIPRVAERRAFYSPFPHDVITRPGAVKVARLRNGPRTKVADLARSADLEAISPNGRPGRVGGDDEAPQTVQLSIGLGRPGPHGDLGVKGRVSQEGKGDRRMRQVSSTWSCDIYFSHQNMKSIKIKPYLIFFFSFFSQVCLRADAQLFKCICSICPSVCVCMTPQKTPPSESS